VTPLRAFAIYLYAVDTFGNYSNPTVLEVSNPAPVLTSVTVTAVAEGFNVKIGVPTDLDYQGIVIHDSSTSFTPSDVTLKYQGPSTDVFIPATPGDVRYVQVAAYDGFGGTVGPYSTEVTVTPLAVPTSKQTIGAKINQNGYDTGTSNGWAYFHGFDANGNAIDEDGYIYYRGTKYYVDRTQGSWSSTLDVDFESGGYIILNVDTAGFTVAANATKVVQAKMVQGTWYYDNGSSWTTFTATSSHCIIGTIRVTSAGIISQLSLYNTGIPLVDQSGGHKTNPGIQWPVTTDSIDDYATGNNSNANSTTSESFGGVQNTWETYDKVTTSYTSDGLATTTIQVQVTMQGYFYCNTDDQFEVNARLQFNGSTVDQINGFYGKGQFDLKNAPTPFYYNMAFGFQLAGNDIAGTANFTVDVQLVTNSEGGWQSPGTWYCTSGTLLIFERKK
jgi:hypothetical protein